MNAMKLYVWDDVFVDNEGVCGVAFAQADTLQNAITAVMATYIYETGDNPGKYTKYIEEELTKHVPKVYDNIYYGNHYYVGNPVVVADTEDTLITIVMEEEDI